MITVLNGKVFHGILGAVTGLANGLFGSGGGVVAVPMLEKGGAEPKKAHATSLALTLPLSVISAVFYSFRGTLPFSEAMKLVPFGLAGAALGSILLKKVPVKWLKRIFGLLLIAAGGRMLFL